MSSRDDADTLTYIRDLGWVGAGIGGAMGIDFVFYLLTGKLLGPESFGVFGVIMAMYYLLIGAPARILEMMSKRLEAEERDAIAQLASPTLALGMLFWTVFLVFSPQLSTIIDVPTDVLRMFAFVFPAAYVVPTLLGRLHGQERFHEYAQYEVIASLARFTGIGFILLGMGVIGAVTGLALELVVGAALLYVFLRPVAMLDSFRGWRLLSRSTVFIVSVYASFSIDVLLLHVFHPVELVGLYNAVTVLGKALFFAAVAVNRAAFPKFVKQENPGNLLHIAAVLITVAGIVAAVGFQFEGGLILALTFGPEYTGAAAFAPLYMLFIAAVGLLSLIGNYQLANDDCRLWMLLFLPMIQISGILLFHATPQHIILVGIAAAVVTGLLMRLPIRWYRGITALIPV